jgi:aminoglycoside phosphotransferase
VPTLPFVATIHRRRACYGAAQGEGALARTRPAMNPAAPGALLGAGKEARVHAWGDRAIKLYNAGGSKHRPFREAAILAFAESLGLPVPAVHEVTQIDGRWAIVMDRIGGRSLADTMRRDPQTLSDHLARMATLHRSVHAQDATPLGGLRQRLVANIRTAPGLGNGDRRRLLTGLRGLPDGDRLCHGDFHPGNILGDPQHPTIVDWLDATRGDPLADVCRSYVLMQPVAPDLAWAYVAAYCAAAGCAREDVQRWLPFVAAARLAENVPDQTDALLDMASIVR